MYKPAAVTGIFLTLFIISAGCAVHPAQSNTTSKPGIVTEPPTAVLPPLPEQYNSLPAVIPHANPAVTTPTFPESLPRLEPEQRSTINETDLSGNSSNSSTSVTVVPAISGTAAIPIAQFTISTDNGYAPLNVQFTDSSLNNPVSWSWNFGDNTFSTDQNPSHSYTTGGAFPATLTVKNAAGTGTYTANILVYAPRISINPDHGTEPLTVSFAEDGFGVPAPTAWLWAFGDGGSCTGRDPTHQYLHAGVYDLALRITGPEGITWVNRTSSVVVT